MWSLTLIVLVFFAWLALRRANELCALALTPEGARLLRGRAPAQLIADASEISRRAGIHQAMIRVVSESGDPRLVPPTDLSDAVTQQLRNVVGQYRVVHFRTGKRPAR